MLQVHVHLLAIWALEHHFPKCIRCQRKPISSIEKGQKKCTLQEVRFKQKRRVLQVLHFKCPSGRHGHPGPYAVQFTARVRRCAPHFRLGRPIYKFLDQPLTLCYRKYIGSEHARGRSPNPSCATNNIVQLLHIVLFHRPVEIPCLFSADFTDTVLLKP